LKYKLGVVYGGILNDAVYSVMKEMNDNFTATARCHPDDKWDVSYGKELAKKRLLMKWHKAQNKVWERIWEELINCEIIVRNEYFKHICSERPSCKIKEEL
jgi:hypothetical protein